LKINTKELKELIREAISEVVLEANKEPLWTKETAKDTIKQIKKGLKNAVPYLDGIGTGFGGESIIGKISLDDKKTWSNNILENSRWCLIHLHPNGTLDTIRMNGYDSMKERKKVPILRKSKNKSVKQMIDRMGKYFTVVRTKYPTGHLGEGKKLTESLGHWSNTLKQLIKWGFGDVEISFKGKSFGKIKDLKRHPKGSGLTLQAFNTLLKNKAIIYKPDGTYQRTSKIKKYMKAGNLQLEGKLTEGKMVKLLLPVKDRKKVVHILQKQLKLKISKDFEYGGQKGSNFVIELDKKLEDKVLELFMKSKIKVRG